LTKSKTIPNIVIILINLFTVGDFIGRSLPQFVFPPAFLKSHIWIFVCLRFAFFPLIVFGVHTRGGDPIISSSYAPLIIMVLFSLSNGYFGSYVMTVGPIGLTPKEQRLAGTMLSFFLNLGIFLGVHFSLLLKYIVTGALSLDN